MKLRDLVPQEKVFVMYRVTELVSLQRAEKKKWALKKIAPFPKDEFDYGKENAQ